MTKDSSKPGILLKCCGMFATRIGFAGNVMAVGIWRDAADVALWRTI